jgi:hypothetical protein
MYGDSGRLPSGLLSLADSPMTNSITSILKDALTHLPIKHLGQEEPTAKHFTDVEEAVTTASV